MIFISNDRVSTLCAAGEKIQIGAPSYERQPYNVTLTAAGNNEINNYAGINTLIKTGNGDNLTIINTESKNTSVETGRGNDTVKVWADSATIKFGGNSNTVKICADTKILLDVGTSNNYEIEYFNKASADITLTDGNGNYTVRGTTGENIFDYTIPDSNLVIESYGGEDLIRVRQSIGTPKVSGDDVVIPVGRGLIIVKNAKAHTININGNKTVVGKYASGLTPHQVIKKFMAALARTKLRGIDAVNEAVQKSSKFSDIDEVIACMINDCKRIRDADKFLRECCNIICDNADTGSITGWDAGSSTVKTKESIVDEQGMAKIFRGNFFVVNGLKVNVPPTPRGIQQNIINGLYTWWVKNTLDLIEESYGIDYSFNAPRASVREINVEFYNNGNWLALVNHKCSNSTGLTTALTLRINMKYYSEMDAHDVNGNSFYNKNNVRAAYLDRTLAHEFTHAVMATNIKFFNELPAWFKEGTAEMTHGISDERHRDLKILAGNPSKLFNALKSHTPDILKVTVKDVNAPVYSAGFILLHYFAKKVANTR